MSLLFVSRWKAAKEGFKTTEEPAPRKDFSVFMQIKIIGASKGFETSNQGTKQNNGAGKKISKLMDSMKLCVINPVFTASMFMDHLHSLIHITSQT